MHGPKSVLCTQILPLECPQCLPRAAAHSPRPTSPTNTAIAHSYDPQPPSLQKTNTNNTLPSDFSRASTTIDSAPPSPTIERHALFVKSEQNQEPAQRFRYGRAQGDTCASCSFSVPRDVAAHLPEGAPGCVGADGKGKNGSPVLRSRELVCLGDGDHSGIGSIAEHEYTRAASDRHRPSTSFRSDASADLPCHDHVLTYLTSRNPDDPTSFSTLRASVIRTLSCELLPRGMSDGPFCFGDSITGYTIAYVFRLTDPKARGRRRAYAFVALAGKDASRAFRACPMVWEAFASMARGIEEAAQRSQDAQREKEEEQREADKSRNYTPISSFLTQRAVDPDGFPRRAGQVSPRSLSEIVGDENIFPLLHQYFVAILRCLGDRFGGLPISDQSVYQTTISDPAPTRLHTHTVDNTSDSKISTKSHDTKDIEAAIAKFKLSGPSVKAPAQCGPLSTDQPAGPQVMRAIS